MLVNMRGEPTTAGALGKLLVKIDDIESQRADAEANDPSMKEWINDWGAAIEGGVALLRQNADLTDFNIDGAKADYQKRVEEPRPLP